MTAFAAYFVSALTGYLSMTLEMLWIRLLAYSTAAHPDTFSHVVGSFLVGLAIGAYLFPKIKKVHPVVLVRVALAGAGLTAFLHPPFIALMFTSSELVGTAAGYASVALGAALTGGSFPLLCDWLGEGKGGAGATVARLYVANIIGSTAGPLLTGYVLLDHFSLEQLFAFTAVGLFAASALLGLFQPGERPLGSMGAGVAAALVVALLWAPLYRDLLEKLHFKTERGAHAPYTRVMQNRTGIVAVESTPDIDRSYGGGIYDGGFNVLPYETNHNGIQRIYLLAALHRKPEEILEIGLSTGSWARVALAHPAAKTLDSVEINRGNVNLIASYPQTAPLLKDPRVTLHIDDGRRWLHRHPDRKFDFILMNSTFYWRNLSTNLLSYEFFKLCQAHLKPGGIIYLNTTGSSDVIRTVSEVFRYVVDIEGFVAAGDSPFDIPADEWKKVLGTYVMDGRTVFPAGDAKAEVLLSNWEKEHSFADVAPAYRQRRDTQVVTDDNMAVEYKSGRALLLDSRLRWTPFLKRVFP